MRVYARIYARMYARASDCGQMTIREHDQIQDTRPGSGHQRTQHQRTHDNQQSGKPEYICMIAGNEKKYKKS